MEDDGNTALHQAVQRNDLEMIKVLARNGANLELYNWQGQTPIAIAEDAWDVEKKRVGPPPEVLQAMNAGTPIPEVKSAKGTIVLMRELLKWPAWTDADFGGPRDDRGSISNQGSGGGGTVVMKKLLVIAAVTWVSVGVVVLAQRAPQSSTGTPVGPPRGADVGGGGAPSGGDAGGGAAGGAGAGGDGRARHGG